MRDGESKMTGDGSSARDGEEDWKVKTFAGEEGETRDGGWPELGRIGGRR